MQKKLNVPYFSQLDNPSGEGHRECFPTSVAMLLAYRGLIKSDEEYFKICRRYGDITVGATHCSAVKSFGVDGKFYLNKTKSDLIELIDNNNPVAVGWLHQGDLNNPTGFGHWSVLTGYNDLFSIHNDPFGEADLLAGGYTPNTNGKNQSYTWKNWLKRWEVKGNDGWVFYLL